MSLLNLFCILVLVSRVSAYLTTCTHSSSEFVYTWLEFPNGGGFQIVKLDTVGGCINETLYSNQNSEFGIAQYSQMACSSDGRYISFPSNSADDGHAYLYFDTKTGQLLSETRGITEFVKYAWHDRNDRPIIIYPGSNNELKIGSPKGPTGTQGHIYCSFTPPQGATNRIGAFNQRDQSWYLNYVHPDDTESLAVIDLNGDYSTHNHNLRIFDMYYNRTSERVVLAYAKTPFDGSCGGLPSSPATNPRATTVYFSEFSSGQIYDPFASIIVEDCLRWHAISGASPGTYFFYTQKDSYNGQGQLVYQNGVGKADLYHGGTVAAQLSPYWGYGVDSALYGFCAVGQN